MRYLSPDFIVFDDDELVTIDGTCTTSAGQGCAGGGSGVSCSSAGSGHDCFSGSTGVTCSAGSTGASCTNGATGVDCTGGSGTGVKCKSTAIATS